MAATAVLHARVVQVEPGGAASLQLRVRNTGRVVDQFLLEVLGAAAAWSTVTPPTLSLLPGREDTATITFNPPRDPGVPAGEVPVGVRVGSREDPEGTTVEECRLQVGAFHQAEAELLPRTARGWSAARYELAVDNRGNAPMAAALTAKDPEAALRFRFQPDAVAPAPGRAAFAGVRVRSRRVFLSGPPRPHPFQVVVAPDGSAPIVLDGTLVQAALVASWMRTAALAALAGIVALALLWVFAVRPGVESTARGAVAAPLAQQAAQVAGLEKKVDSLSPTGTTQPTAQPTGQPNPPPPAPDASGFARRLDAGGPQYRVPQGMTLSITDVVFQNPDSEHGSVRLELNGAALLVENLDNFRDLDYHFVTPIAVAGNQTIQMTTRCDARCPGAAVYLNGTLRKG